MRRGRFHFAGDLERFLLPCERGRDVERTWADSDTLMHVIESIGVPHTEVGRIEQSDDRFHVFPSDGEPASRFVLDQHLGRLAAYLRMLGFDVLHTVPSPDAELAATSSREDRVLLTRDVGLLKRREVVRGYFVRATEPRVQLLEVVRRFRMVDAIAAFTRCVRCNTPLDRAEKAAVEGLLPRQIAQLHDEFSRCPTCGRVFWKGSHYDRMQLLIGRLRIEAGEAPSSSSRM